MNMNPRSNIRRALSVMIVVMMLASPMFVLEGNSASVSHERTMENADLLITGTFVIDQNTRDPASKNMGMYGQDGNITVANGGTLIVRNATLYFIQDDGNDENNASDDHHYWMDVQDGGRFIMENGTLTVSDKAVHPYLQLPVTINGTAIFSDSLIMYPGTFTVNHGVLYANDTIFKGLNKDDMSDAISDKDANDDCPLMSFIDSNVSFADSRVEDYYSYDTETQIDFVPASKGATADSTGEDVSNLTSKDGITYPVEAGEQMYIDSFINAEALPTWATSKTTVYDVTLYASWMSNDTYNGSSSIYVGPDAGSLSNTGIMPTKSMASDQAYAVPTSDFRTVGDIMDMDVNFTHNGDNGSLPFDQIYVRAHLSRSYNISVSGGNFSAINTYLGVDFRDLNLAGEKDYFAASDGADVRFYNVTVNEEITHGDHKDFAFFAKGNTTKIYLYGWLNAQTIDGNALDPTPVPYCKITSKYYAPSPDAERITSENNTLHNGDPVLEYLNRTSPDRNINEMNYKITNASGMARIPLLKNRINASDLNGLFLGNYNVTTHENIHNTNLSLQINFLPYPKITADNNTFNSNFSFSWEYPPRDLNTSVSDIVTNPDPVVRDDNVSFNVTIHNIGGINVTRPFNVTLSVDGSEVSRASIAQMVERNGGTVNALLYWNTSYGDYGAHEITVSIDPDGSILDGNRSNNNVTYTLYVHARYDLSITPEHIWWENTTYGENYTYINLTINADVYNVGNDDVSGNIRVEFYVDHSFVGADTINGMPAGTHSVASTKYSTDTAGIYNVSVKVILPSGIDDDNMVNNSAYRMLSTDATPDLTVDSISFNPSPVIESFDTTINTTVKNIGETYANGTITVDFYDNTTGEHIGQASLNTNLSAGFSTVLSITWNAKRPADSYHTIYAVVSFTASGSNPPETHTSNNGNTADIYVEKYIDLSISDSDITVNSTNPYTYQQIDINATVHNSGNESIGSFDVEIYVNSALIKTVTIDHMAVHTDTTVNASFNTSSSGTYTIEVVVDSGNSISEVFEGNNTASTDVTISPNPDLAVDSVSFNPSPVIESFNTTINATVKNIGETYANGTITVDFYDNTTGEHIGQASLNTNLSAGSSTVLSITWNAKRPADSHHMIYAVVSFTASASNPPETHTSNNGNTADIYVEKYIDLSISDSDITVTPGSPYTYQRINISATVHNSGNESVGAFMVEIYVNGIPINTTDIDGMLAGASVDVQANFMESISGYYSITVVADSTDAISEVFEANNSASQTIMIFPTPDLTISGMNASASVVEYDNATITAEVKNIGQTYANGTITVDFYDNTTGSLIGSNVTTTNLSAGASMEASIIWQGGAPGGNHTFYAVVSFVNSNGNPPETMVDNNRYDMEKPIFVMASIDLAISPTDISFTPAAPLTYEDINISALIHNNGKRDISERFTVEFLVGSTRYTADVNGLAAGNSTSVQITFRTQKNFNYTVTVTVDPDRVIADFNRDNNAASISMYVGPRPELYLQSLDILSNVNGEAAVVENHAVGIAATVVNTGCSATGTVGVYFYDGNPDMDGTQIGYAEYSDPVGNGNSITLTTQWTAEGVGSHTIYARVVASTSPPEGNLNDNTRSSTLNVLARPDLTVTNITFLKGDSIINTTSESRDFDINVTIQNTGGNLSDSNVEGFTVTLFSGMPIAGNFSNAIGNISVDNMSLMDSGLPVNFTFPVSGFSMVPGLTNIYAVVDFDNMVDESNEANNSFNRTLDILQADLAIQVSSPAPDQTINMDEQTSITLIGQIIDRADGQPLTHIPMTIMLVDTDSGEQSSSTNHISWVDNQNTFIANLNTPGAPGTYTIRATATTPSGDTLNFQQSNVHFSVQRAPQESNFWWIIILIVVIVILASVGGIVYWIKTKYAGKYVECGNCGKMIPSGSDKCPYCGAVFDKETVKCSVCGAWIPADATECPKCGAKFLVGGKEIVDYETQMKHQYEDFVEKFRKQAKKEMGKDFTEEKFQQWWRTQNSFVTFEDWLKREEERKKTGGILCPHCGALNSKTDIVCHVCGTPLRATKKKTEESNIDEASISTIELPSLKKEEEEGEKLSEENAEEAPKQAEEAKTEEKPAEEKPRVAKKVVKRKVVKTAPAISEKRESGGAAELPPDMIAGMNKKPEEKAPEVNESQPLNKPAEDSKPPEEKPPIAKKKIVKKVVRKKVVKK